MPWRSISVLKGHRVVGDTGSQQMVSVVLERPEVALTIPWHSELDKLVPQSIGIS